MPRVFNNIPESERSVDGIEHYRYLAERARETSFGLLDRENAIVNLCCRVEEAEADLDDAFYAQARIESQAEQIDKLRNEIKGLRMTIGRMKKRKEKANEKD